MRGILVRPAVLTAAFTIAVSVSLAPAGAANAAPGAKHLVWKPAYLAHVTSGRIISATAPSARSVWALGRTFPARGQGVSFLLHWNGQHWRRSGLPARGVNGVLLASSPGGSVWMFGWTKPAGGRYEGWRWNGHRWLWITLPRNDQFGIAGAAVISATDVWVLSGDTASRWNGRAWQPTSLPGGDSYQAISGGGKDIWVAGLAPGAQDLTGHLVVLRWLRGAWRKVGLPGLGLIRAPRQPMLTAAAGNTWVSAPGTKPVLLHWTGSRWRQLADPNPLSQFLVGYGRAGVWADWGDLWTGSRWVGPRYGGPALMPTALAAVPGSTATWLFAGGVIGGPEVLRAVWQ